MNRILKNKYAYFILFFIFAILILFGITEAFAADVVNAVDDTTSIEADLSTIGIDINDYYELDEPAKKTYIIGYTEAILEDNTIQAYVYAYVSFDNIDNTFKFESLSYKIGSTTSTLTDLPILDKVDNYLYKIKAFKYAYEKDVDITLDIINLSTVVYETNYAYKNNFVANCNEFKLSVSHSLVDANNPVSIELAFDSVILIDEIQLVKVNVQPELWETCSFAAWWNTFFDMDNKELYLHFYNFNFPDHVEVDSIEYAKFEYDYVNYTLWTWDYLIGEDKVELIENSREYKLKEYLPCSNNFETYNQSGELEFETFTLGNRYTLGEFPDYVAFTDEQKALFNYDASILLDSSVSKDNYNSTSNIKEKNYYELENVNFLELHYSKDGTVYKCQVIAENVGDEDDDKESTVSGNQPGEVDNLQKLKNKIKQFFDFSFDTFSNAMKSIGKIIGILFGTIGFCFLWRIGRFIFGTFKGKDK